MHRRIRAGQLRAVRLERPQGAYYRVFLDLSGDPSATDVGGATGAPTAPTATDAAAGPTGPTATGTAVDAATQAAALAAYGARLPEPVLAELRDAQARVAEQAAALALREAAVAQLAAALRAAQEPWWRHWWRRWVWWRR